MDPGPERGVVLERGTLWQSVLRQTRRAVRRGALEPIPTEFEVIEQRGVAFAVRIVANLARKQFAARAQDASPANPFLPFDEDLFVAEVSDSHVCLLNKFNVLEHHVLLVTRSFEDQEILLSEDDFAALWTCMAEFDAVGFYNAGTAAGASQRHKHLQLVPLPLGTGPQRTPIDPLLAATPADGTVASVPGLPFAHAVVRLGAWGDPPPAEATRDIYLAMLRALGRERAPGPYNLLVTRDWILLVPRTKEHCGAISVNALGFAGALLVRDRDQLDFVRRRGPMAVLESVAVARA